mgnify:CR=1 FL=1
MYCLTLPKSYTTAKFPFTQKTHNNVVFATIFSATPGGQEKPYPVRKPGSAKMLQCPPTGPVLMRIEKHSLLMLRNRREFYILVIKSIGILITRSQMYSKISKQTCDVFSGGIDRFHVYITFVHFVQLIVSKIGRFS